MSQVREEIQKKENGLGTDSIYKHAGLFVQRYLLHRHSTKSVAHRFKLK
jgi:hypothetical protein